MPTITGNDVLRAGSVLVILIVLATIGYFAALDRRFEKAPQTKCTNNLKQIGLAAIQYADDHKGFLPHLAATETLDGGLSSNTASRVGRALMNLTYLEYSEVFVCPSSPDDARPHSPSARADLRCWRWGGANAAPVTTGVAALLPDGAVATDKPLDEATELSYGWTRRGLTFTSPNTAFVAGDKSRRTDGPKHTGNLEGNHKDCMLVVCVDGHTERIKPDSPHVTTRTIASTEGATAGFLGVLADDGP